MTKQTCRTCKWAECAYDKRGIVKYKAVKCLWPVPAFALPLSITNSFGFCSLDQQKGWVWPDTADCPTWEEKNDKASKI